MSKQHVLKVLIFCPIMIRAVAAIFALSVSFVSDVAVFRASAEDAKSFGLREVPREEQSWLTRRYERLRKNSQTALRQIRRREKAIRRARVRWREELARRQKDARETVERKRDRHRGGVEILYQKGVWLWNQGRYPEAGVFFDDVHALSPNYKKTEYYRERLKERRIFSGERDVRVDAGDVQEDEQDIASRSALIETALDEMEKPKTSGSMTQVSTIPEKRSKILK